MGRTLGHWVSEGPRKRGLGQRLPDHSLSRVTTARSPTQPGPLPSPQHPHPRRAWGEQTGLNPCSQPQFCFNALEVQPLIWKPSAVTKGEDFPDNSTEQSHEEGMQDKAAFFSLVPQGVISQN